MTRLVRHFLALVLLGAAALHAQTTASLTGLVVDGDGNPLAGAKVTVRSNALQGTRDTYTDDGGVYNFAALPPGAYNITFSFGEWMPVPAAARLQLGQTTRADATIQPGIIDRITVDSSVPAPVATPEIATNLTLREVERLPVQRNQLATAQLMPGVTANVLSNGQLSIAGGPGYDNLVLVNGVVVPENVRGQIRPMYVEDAIQETTVLTGAISAEYGRFTGGVVSTITRSGGNAFSGSIRDSLSNPSWSAQSPAKEAREDTMNHVWEATLGGFVLRDQLWFFTAGRWAKNDTARQTVPIPAFTGNPSSPASERISFNESNDQKRYEAKLTANLGAQHDLTAAFFGIDTRGERRRTSNNIYDLASLSSQHDPESLVALHYGGVITQSLFVEAQASRRRYSFGETGSQFDDLVHGTVLVDRANGNARYNTAGGCGFCASEHRDNDDYSLKADAFVNRFGSHELVAGADRFEERRRPNAHESGSDFLLFVTRTQSKDGVIYPVITPTTQNGGGTFIRWSPVLVGATDNHLRTDSLFLNDHWTITPRWSASLGVRYDKNHAVDADGTVASDSGRVTPRLAVFYDFRGDGRQRVRASFGEYASRLADSIASANQSAGNAAAIDFAYKGPGINDKALNTPLPDAIAAVFAYFNEKQGGTANTAGTNLRANGQRTVPGFAAYFDGSLQSPLVRETTLGYAAQLSRLFAKVDLIARDWRDFYAASVTPSTEKATTPFGINVDLPLYRNTDDVERTYRAIEFESRWNATPLEAGVFYTYSKLRGNDDGETANGPVPNADPSLYYAEFLNYERYAPVGYLSGDQRHRLRAWVGYDVPLPSLVGKLNVSLLETFDSGLPYSAAGAINVTRYTGAPSNPGYAAIPNGQYFFSDRGEFRTDDIHSTNLAVRYTRPFGPAEVFVQGDLLNAFNNDGIADPLRIGTGVVTAATSANYQPFNPFTETPERGKHYDYAPNFGQPLNNLAYQTPRTIRFSLGARF